MRSRYLPLLIAVAACSRDLPVETPVFGSRVASAKAENGLTALARDVNARLDASGAGYRLGYAEWLGADEAGQTLLFADVGNKRLGHDFVPGDPRRGGRTNITYIVDESEGAVDGLSASETTGAIDRAMATWDALSCSTIPISMVSPVAGDLGIIELLSGLGGSPIVHADITHAGWLPATAFNLLFGPAGPFVIGVTFTFIYFDGPTPSDINNDGRADVAFREINYNDRFSWFVSGSDTDVETVALHEAGHGLSQAHFGQLFRTNSNNKLHFAPRAVMNAAYTGSQQALQGTDVAGHCSNWASWPNR